uniref:Phosphatase and actin regulator n=1 Tax=Caenorhabditis tropicalis TaxID=1561998 RepID=A0A1I7TWI8_9PELO
MPVPLNFICCTEPSSDPKIVDVESIADPEARRIAIQNNSTIERWKEMKEMEKKTRLELEEAVRQYHVIDAIPTLTPEEKDENRRLTMEKSRKVRIIQKRREELALEVYLIRETQKESEQKP